MATRSLPKPSKLKSPLSCSFRLEIESGFSRVLGIDEVGRGCLAGPVVVAGVVFPKEFWSSDIEWLADVDDSKKLKAEKRKMLSEKIRDVALSTHIASCDPLEVDQINILQATFKAARDVLGQTTASLGRPPEFVLMDGSQKIPGVLLRQHCVVDGDRISKSIAAASIVAKVYRDELMTQIALEHPGYGFEKHKGYGTKEHMLALRKLGPCPIHRRSFLKKLEAVAYGRDAEDKAVSYLEKNDFKILVRNWRSPAAEIDVVAEKDGELHFIEVRFRSLNTELPMLFPVTKQNQVKRAVEIFFAANPRAARENFHVNLFSVTSENLVPYWDVFKF